jgi:diguanylate cyclase (GGDEF)-like protein
MAVGFVPFAIVLGIILILVILQQILAMRENQNLNEELMVALRTIQVRQDELLLLNQSLQGEITERKLLEKRLQHDILHDPLTGLPNRVLFLDRLGQAIELGIRHPQTNYAVLFLDLDQFKSANDEFGHFCGDRLLVEVSRRLSGSLRATDTVARLGGDEFVFLLEDVTAEGIHEVIERIKEELNPPIQMMGKTFQITASIGVVNSLYEYYNPEQVLEDADRAMYHAKSQGKDGYAIYSKN